MVFLKMVKEKLEKKEQEVCELANENQRLKVRAAAAWEELTPRPSFSGVINKLIARPTPHVFKFGKLFDLDERFFEKKTSANIAEELKEVCKQHLAALQKDRLKQSRKVAGALKRNDSSRSSFSNQNQERNSFVNTPTSPSNLSKVKQFIETKQQSPGRLSNHSLHRQRSKSCEKLFI